MSVIDASALLAFILKERGGDGAAATFAGGVMSAANISEALAVLIRKGATIEEALAGFRDTGIVAAPVSEEHAVTAAALSPLTRHAGLSLGDRLCLSLALELNRPAVTAEKSWKSLAVGIEIQLIR